MRRAIHGLFLVAALVGLLPLAARATGFAFPDTCTDCITVTDTCCAKPPHIQDPTSPPLSQHVLVTTRQPESGFPYSVEIFDLTSPLPSGPEDMNWAGITRYMGPGNSWNQDSLGTVFGLTLDRSGNIFVCHTSCYNGDGLGQVFGSTAGSVYRIDGGTGAINVFVNLPNFPDGSLTPPDDMPGLGNITYDCGHDQFFVTNMEDGKIYRIKPVGTTGSIVQTFDPMAPDNGLPGFAPLGERLWAVQIHGNRVFYSVWAEDSGYPSATAANEIRSVGLDATGAILPGTDKHEMYMPPLASCTWCTSPMSNPVSDISFSANGRMLLGERSMNGASYSSAHSSRVLEYQCQNFCWQRTSLYGVGDYYVHENSAGGVDYDRSAYVAGGALGRTWASGDAIHLFSSYTDAIYGFQGFRPGGGPDQTTSLLIDSDSFTSYGDKTEIGDIEAPGCPSTIGSLCGQKFEDLNHNGVADPGEPTLPGWTIQLVGPNGTYTTVTDATGGYCFTDVNPGNYTLSEIGQASWVQTAPAGGTYSVTYVNGVAQGGFNFGNYFCGAAGGGGTTGCVMPPPGMGAWWPFNEPVSSALAYDVTHMSPPRNVAQLFGGAAILTGGEVGNRLCFSSDLDYAKVVNANQLGINFAAASFSADCWIKMAAGTGGIRMIAEKRVLVSASPYRTRGWALYLNGLQLFLELGNGVATQVVPGPTLSAATWNHIAVTVDRPTVAGKWYVNGSNVVAFNFAPLAGNLYTTADLYMGKASPSFQSQIFQGCIDELELFTSTLPATSVLKLYLAGTAGKCPEYCRVPQVTTICRSQSSVTVCFNICNNTGTAQSYHWSLAPLPAGPGCSVAGPTVFSPPAGAITVPAMGCSGPICVNIPRPAGLTAQNLTSCYSLSYVNDNTGACYTCTGTIRADYTCYCITPIGTGEVIGIPALAAASFTGVPISIGIGVSFPCDPTYLPYRITAVARNTDHADPLKLSLNGLPPGEPVVGTLQIQPGTSPELTVLAKWVGDYDANAPYDILIEADTDGDGTLDPVGVVPVAATYDSTATASAPAPSTRLEDSVRLQAWPNPFTGGSSVAFTLSRTDDVSIGVYDVNGRLVRSLQSGMMTAGAHAIAWDGRTPDGQRAPAGVYFVRLESSRVHIGAKLVKLN